MGLSISALLLLLTLSIFTSGLSHFQKTDTRLALSQTGALAMRRITEDLRSAISVSVAPDGRSMTYELPLLSGAVDPVTGEREYVVPIQSDGIVRSFYEESDVLYYQVAADDPFILAEGVSATDPDEGSIYFGLSYPIFEFETVGTSSGIRVTLIGQEDLGRSIEVSRMSSFVKLQDTS